VPALYPRPSVDANTLTVRLTLVEGSREPATLPKRGLLAPNLLIRRTLRHGSDRRVLQSGAQWAGRQYRLGPHNFWRRAIDDDRGSAPWSVRREERLLSSHPLVPECLCLFG
jgi:hypothetical protein